MSKHEKTEFELRVVNIMGNGTDRVLSQRIQYRQIKTTSYITELGPRGPHVSKGDWKDAKTINVYVDQEIPND